MQDFSRIFGGGKIAPAHERKSYNSDRSNYMAPGEGRSTQERRHEAVAEDQAPAAPRGGRLAVATSIRAR
jgi:hypothetical protein